MTRPVEVVTEENGDIFLSRRVVHRRLILIESNPGQKCTLSSSGTRTCSIYANLISEACPRPSISGDNMLSAKNRLDTQPPCSCYTDRAVQVSVASALQEDVAVESAAVMKR